MLTAFLIMLREGFEAALIVAIIYAYLRRTDRADLLRPMWLGVGVAALLSLAIGIVVHRTVEGLEGDARLRAFAAISVCAVIVLTWMVFWMRGHARHIRGQLQASIDAAASSPGKVQFAVAAAAFFAVVREGFEAALFLVAAATTDTGAQVLLGGVIGLAIAAALGWLVVVGGRRLPLRQFFTVTGMVLIVFAAGLLARTVAFLQYAGDLPILRDAIYDLTAYPWLTIETEVGRFLAAMFGWDPRPSIEQVVAWVAYLTITTVLFLKPQRAKPAEQRAPQPEDARAAR